MENTGKTSWQKIRSIIWNLFGTTGRTGPTVTSHRLLRGAAAVLLLAVGFCLLTGSQAMAAGAYRRPITIAPVKLGSSCSANVTGFPVLVSIESSANASAAVSLRSAANGGQVENGNGYDIVFTDAGGTPLNHEVERWDPATGTLVAWVYVPALSTSVDTVIYMVYGDSGVSAPTETPNAVWDGNYKGVWLF